MDDVNAYIELIKDNIEYEHHMKYDDWQNKALYEELFEVICEVVCVKRTTIRIAGEDYPYELVKSKFLKLNSGHLEYVIGCMHDTNTKITNIKAYMVTALYNVNAPYQVPYKLKAASAALLHCFFGFLTTSGNFSDHGSRSSKNDRSLSSMRLGISVRRCSKYSYGFRLFAFAVSAML